MGRYVKKICPNCDYVIQNYTLDNTYGMVDIGIPFEICPKCQTLLLKKNIKEFNMLTKFDYVRMWFWNILSSLLLSGIISGAITALILKIFNSNNGYYFFIFWTTIFVYFIKNYYTTQKKQIKESKERLQNAEYKKLIEQIRK